MTKPDSVRPRIVRPHVVIISPALAKANNGNGQTAQRWARFLHDHYRVSYSTASDTAFLSAAPSAIIALHARRSAAALAAFAAQYPARPSVLVLTGTDIYRDIHADAQAARSLQLATRLVVLQAAALQELDATLQKKTLVIYQSAVTLKPVIPPLHARHFDVTMIGHLREEKDPATFMRAAALVTVPRVRLQHIGGVLDATLAALAEVTQRQQQNYRWLGNLPHAQTRQRLKRSDLMVITSKMEGGANVIIEAITSGVPVLASDISGNRGMLGQDYAGYFAAGDSRALAQMMDRAATDAEFYTRLQTQCAARAALFAPQREKAAVLHLMDNLIATTSLRHYATT